MSASFSGGAAYLPPVAVVSGTAAQAPYLFNGATRTLTVVRRAFDVVLTVEGGAAHTRTGCSVLCVRRRAFAAFFSRQGCTSTS